MIENDLFRNGSGYVDMTAYLAMNNYMKGKNDMALYSGDIVKGETNSGNIKEYVVLSVHARYSQVLVLQDNDECFSVNCFPVKCGSMKYTDPGMVSYMFNDKLAGFDFVRPLNAKELDALMQAVFAAFEYEGYSAKTDASDPVVKEVVKEVPVPVQDPGIMEELTRAKAERDVFKSLYENLISSMLKK